MDSAEGIGYRIGYVIGYVIGSTLFWPFVFLSIATIVFLIVMARRQPSR